MDQPYTIKPKRCNRKIAKNTLNSRKQHPYKHPSKLSLLRQNKQRYSRSPDHWPEDIKLEFKQVCYHSDNHEYTVDTDQKCSVGPNKYSGLGMSVNDIMQMYRDLCAQRQTDQLIRKLGCVNI